MTLEMYSRYYDPATDRTVVAVHDADSAFFVRFDAVLTGNLLDRTDSELLDRAIAWFTNRYVQEYATQQLDSKVREFEAMMQSAQEQIALSASSRSAFLQIVMMLYGKGLLSDEDLLQTGLFDDEAVE